MKKTELSTTIQRVLIVYLFLLIGLITYIAYFQLFKAPQIAEKPNNVRLMAKRNEVLRGTIFDRNGLALTKSEKVDPVTQKRTYTQGEYYGNIIGYASPKYGYSQLEKSFDNQLINYDSITLQKFLKSLDLKSAWENRNKPEQKVGNSVYTTLDTRIQKAAYDALGDYKGAVVVLNPKNGDILAMVSKPSFNPNELDKVIPKANSGELKDYPLMNRVLSGMYPPGSTFKVVTLTSALENISGVRNRVFQDDGKIVFNSKQSLRNLDGTAYGPISLKKALEVSSNVVFGTLAGELGNDKLKATAEKYGFNQTLPTQGLYLEQSKFPTISKSEPGSIAQSGIGQSSVLATPMQMALVASTVANDGTMMEPTIVNKIVNKDGDLVEKTSPKIIKSGIVAKNDVATIKEYMKAIVDDRINADWGVFAGTNAAGKTGTADYNLANGQDATPHSWFIGFAPADNPQYAIAVIVESGGHGGLVAAPIAGSILKTALSK
ncbi:peptidoglycan D,D-transpeptidase FtsI family protein [Inconstantimicrobium mannanitabidum]|uniref:Beta-lactamase n=1 Tax=Inconstantimicrobium mannanitabidum TaxID=1604901 RepID=A0ACB5RG18_9CLOT|nr:penicillin-binding transpeptidase domain-containing protein [Clostridium sp. TW13]GKX68038.1 beta-lactamase [Clostridium sp. TW13]